MSTPAPSDVAELFGMLFGTTVEVTEVERDPGTHWLALCMFSTPENEPIAVVGADIPAIAAQGAALAGYPVEDMEEAVTKGRINSEVAAKATPTGAKVSPASSAENLRPACRNSANPSMKLPK